VPTPATGNTAFLIFIVLLIIASLLFFGFACDFALCCSYNYSVSGKQQRSNNPQPKVA
jgi:hypothetical protein